MKYSIITVNYNNRDGLRATIESVVNQTYRDYEFIVIDGGSTDGSTDVLKEFDDKITYWVSEPDKGIYNGMNKGIAKATGDYLNFMNSGRPGLSFQPNHSTGIRHNPPLSSHNVDILSAYTSSSEFFF